MKFQVLALHALALSRLSDLISVLAILLQPYWLLLSLRHPGKSLTQDFCACCSLCLECSSPRFMFGPLPSRRSLCPCRLIRQGFLACLSKVATVVPLAFTLTLSPYLIFLLITTCNCIFTCLLFIVYLPDQTVGSERAGLGFCLLVCPRRVSVNFCEGRSMLVSQNIMINKTVMDCALIEYIGYN